MVLREITVTELTQLPVVLCLVGGSGNNNLSVVMSIS
jgi:hypothetical protein